MILADDEGGNGRTIDNTLEALFAFLKFIFGTLSFDFRLSELFEFAAQFLNLQSQIVIRLLPAFHDSTFCVMMRMNMKLPGLLNPAATLMKNPSEVLTF